MDVDRRYYNKNVGTASTDYANIDLQPGYQRLNGEQALDFVRFRHTDSDLYRVARQQEFVRSFREQVAQNFSFSKVPALVNAIASNIEVAEGGHKVQLSEIEKYAFFALRRCRPGTSSRTRSRTCSAQNQCYVAQSDIDAAVQQFTNPDVSSSKAGERGGARQEDQAHDAAAVVGDRDRPERQRRRGRGGQRDVPALAGGLQGAPAAEQPRAERAGEDPPVPHQDLLRRVAAPGEGRRRRAGED